MPTATPKKTVNGRVTEYIYNYEERLIAVKVDGQTVGRYAYNPEGHRIKKSVNGVTTYFLYNEEGLAAEYDAHGNLIKEYHFKPYATWMTEPLFQRAADGQVYYYQNDHLGTSQRMVRSNGVVVWQAYYSAFGEAEVVIEIVQNNLRLPGQYYEQETGLHHNYFRDYDPELGRYLKSDPIGLFGGLNTFVYVLGRPSFYVGPTGTFFVPGAIVGAVIGGFSAALSANPCLSGGRLAGVILSGMMSGALSGGMPFGSMAMGVFTGGMSAAAGAIGAGAASGNFDAATTATQIGVGAAAGAITHRVGFGVALNASRSGVRPGDALTAGGVFGVAAGSTAAGGLMVLAPSEVGGAGAVSGMNSENSSCGC